MCTLRRQKLNNMSVFHYKEQPIVRNKAGVLRVRSYTAIAIAKAKAILQVITKLWVTKPFLRLRSEWLAKSQCEQSYVNAMHPFLAKSFFAIAITVCERALRLSLIWMWNKRLFHCNFIRSVPLRNPHSVLLWTFEKCSTVEPMFGSSDRFSFSNIQWCCFTILALKLCDFFWSGTLQLN